MNYLMSHTSLNEAFLSLAGDILINGKVEKGVVTTAYLGEHEKRHISSLEPFKQGDHVKYADSNYLITEEVESKRHNKYRATMTLCNYVIEIEVPGELIEKIQTGTDDRGRPIYKNIYAPSTFEYIYGIVYNFQDKITDGQIPIATALFSIDVQHNEENLTRFAMNSVHKYKHREIVVQGHDITRNGLLGLQVKLKTLGA